ncbi:GPP34 family phosphoprotein [Micromonospora sp. STR1s_6]|uniref:GPP34 family phosphoprotein n=1 Tax=Micromonospora tarensis TaxID=2806100 RepID=A0ABS1YJ66_9ACTN|nr:GPP34 family phosphoprotein [Micromonospora tarensis]
MNLSSVAEAMEPPWLGRGEVFRCNDLFLLGHDDTGHPHVHRQTLALGLAGAVLIDRYLAGRVTLDPNIDTHAADHQRIHPHIDRPVGDLIVGAAAATIRNAHPLLREWLRGFRRRVRPHQRRPVCWRDPAPVHRTAPRRPHARRHPPALRQQWAVIARYRLRYLAAGHEQPNDHSAALACLLADLGLILTVLRETPGITYRPSVTDRAGQTGIGLSATADDIRFLLILNPSTGELLAYERAALTPPADSDRNGALVDDYHLFLVHTHTTSSDNS